MRFSIESASSSRVRLDHLVLAHAPDRGGGILRPRRPVALALDATVGAYHHVLRRGELVDALEQRVGLGHERKGQIVVERGVVELGAHRGVAQDGAHLGAEDESLGQRRVQQRLDAEPVPREHELAAAAVPDGEGEHPVQARHAGRALLLVEVQDRLGVGPRAVRVALGLELGAQRLVVVDLAVVGDPDGPVLVGHRLVAGGR